MRGSITQRLMTKARMAAPRFSAPLGDPCLSLSRRKEVRSRILVSGGVNHRDGFPGQGDESRYHR